MQTCPSATFRSACARRWDSGRSKKNKKPAPLGQALHVLKEQVYPSNQGCPKSNSRDKYCQEVDNYLYINKLLNWQLSTTRRVAP